MLVALFALAGGVQALVPTQAAAMTAEEQDAECKLLLGSSFSWNTETGRCEDDSAAGDTGGTGGGVYIQPTEVIEVTPLPPSCLSCNLPRRIGSNGQRTVQADAGKPQRPRLKPSTKPRGPAKAKPEKPKSPLEKCQASEGLMRQMLQRIREIRFELRADPRPTREQGEKLYQEKDQLLGRYEARYKTWSGEHCRGLTGTYFPESAKSIQDITVIPYEPVDARDRGDVP
jgi:hypothetical protein